MSDRGQSIETLLIGIDAACPGILNPLRRDGITPNLDRIRDRGVDQPLRSHIPPWTASAWPSLYTGTNPGKHGVFGFLRFDGYDWSVADASDIGEPALWDILSESGKTSVVVNVPVTHPPREIDGALVPGYMAPENPQTYPTGILDEFIEEHADYRLYPDHDADPLEEYPQLVKRRGGLFRWLADEFDPDFGFLQFQVTDSVFHHHPERWDLVEAVYRAVDDELGQLLEELTPETVIVASDHGMGPYDDVEIRINEYLKRNGYLTSTVGEEGMPAWLPILNDQLRNGKLDATEDRSSGFLERAVTVSARAGLSPFRVGRALSKVGLAGPISRIVPSSISRAGQRSVDFPASKAYMRSRVELGIRLNVEGREPDGIVRPTEYEDLKDELIDELSNLTTPEGIPVFDEVAPRSEYFWGPHASEAVDIVTVPKNFNRFLSADLKGSLFGEPSEPWNHKLDGFLAMSGGAVDEDKRLDSAHIFDVGPTVLASMDVPISDRMDGTILPPVSETPAKSYPAFERGKKSVEDDGRVEDRLKAIGYI